MRNDRIGIFRISQKSRHVAHENEPFGLERNGHLRGGNVRVAIVNFSVLAAGCRADDRRDAAPDTFRKRLNVHRGDFADEAEVNFFAQLYLSSSSLRHLKMSAPENPRALPPSSLDGF